MSQQRKGPGRPRQVKLSPFGQRLRTLIAGSRFQTREAFIEALEIAPASLRRYEIGENDPGADVLQRMASLLDVSVDALLRGAPASHGEESELRGNPFTGERVAEQWQRPVFINQRLRASADEQPFPIQRLDALLESLRGIDLFRELDLLRAARVEYGRASNDAARAEAERELRARVLTFTGQLHALASLLWRHTAREGNPAIQFQLSGKPWPDDIP